MGNESDVGSAYVVCVRGVSGEAHFNTGYVCDTWCIDMKLLYINHIFIYLFISFRLKFKFLKDITS